MAETRIIASIRAVERDAWNRCFPNAVEDYDYLLATEEAGLAGFSWRYVLAFEGGVLHAAMPAFLSGYALDTTLEGTAKKVTTLLRSMVPHALTLKLACIGSPVMENAAIGFHPAVPPGTQAALLEAMLRAFAADALEKGFSLLGVKDVSAAQEALWAAPLAAQGYRQIAGLPGASLAIDFATREEYLARLSPATRKDMRRKLKAASTLRVEWRDTIDDVLPQVMALYHDTRARAAMQFEELTEEFFRAVLRNMPGRAVCVLYYAGDTLLAANLLLHRGTVLLDKFFCMDGARGRDYNLYFASWFANIDYCLANGLTEYQSGQAAAAIKARLGSRPLPCRMYFRHRNRLMQGALRLAAPWLAADEKREAA
jgi:predicted N-acyltransferase